MKAIDLIKKLENDKNYQKQIEDLEIERNRRKELAYEITKPFLKFLHANGYENVRTIGDLLKMKHIDKSLTEIVLSWIPSISNEFKSQEALFRSLAIAKEPFDGQILTQYFDSDTTHYLTKWAIGNTIASTRVENITGWLENKLMSDNLGKECEMLMYAAIKYFPYPKAMFFLKKFVDVFPLQVIDAFTFIAKQDDLEFLDKVEKDHPERPVQTAIKAARKKLKKKLKIQ
jgi:hypothetical protein